MSGNESRPDGQSIFHGWLLAESERTGKTIPEVIAGETITMGSFSSECLLPDECEDLLRAGVVVQYAGGMLKSIEVPAALNTVQRACSIHVRGCSFCQSILASFDQSK